jgi:hypothetical protein
MWRALSKAMPQLEKGLNSMEWPFLRLPFMFFLLHVIMSTCSSKFGFVLFTVIVVFCTTKQVDEEMRVVKVEFFYDPGQLLGGLLKGVSLDGSAEEAATSCPVLRKTG